MRYGDAIEYINSFTNYERVPGLVNDLAEDGLERVRLLLRLLGRPQNGFSSIVIAGTKGKGSVSAMLESILRQNGYRTGLYTSPHLHTFRERIRVAGEMIPPQDVGRLVDQIRPVVDRIRQLGDESLLPTTYELATALAFLYFNEQQVEVAVLEVGLGGLLDAVNVVQPLVSVITSISLDHMQVLGDTLEEIAYQKAGIIKRGIPVVVAPQSAEAMSVISYVASQQEAELIPIGRKAYISSEQLPRIVGDERGLPAYQVFTVGFDEEDGEPRVTTSVELPLLGSHQQVNAAVALATLPVLVGQGLTLERDAVLKGLREVRWPGRFEIINAEPVVVADGAHNTDSMSKLHQTVVELFHRYPVVVVLGLTRDKDIDGIVAEIAGWPDNIMGPELERLIITRSNHPRAADPEEILPEARRHGLPATIAPDLPSALKTAEELASARSAAGTPALVLVTGSLFVVAEAREHYGLAEDLSAEE